VHLEVATDLKDLIAHVASNAAGCRYCQAHTAHTAHKNGVSVEKLQKVWEFQTSDLFSDKERAALNFAFAAGSVPNQVTQEHHEALKQHFSEGQIVETFDKYLGSRKTCNKIMNSGIDKNSINEKITKIYSIFSEPHNNHRTIF